MTATPEQIEAIARAYCVKLGLDPDERVHDARNKWQTRLELAEEAASEALAMQAAIAEVMGGDLAGKLKSGT